MVKIGLVAAASSGRVQINYIKLKSRAGAFLTTVEIALKIYFTVCWLAG